MTPSILQSTIIHKATFPILSKTYKKSKFDESNLFSYLLRMTNESQICPNCNSSYCYQDGILWTCPECFHEWPIENHQETEIDSPPSSSQFLDANGVLLETGDTVVVIKDLKIGKDTIKSGTKVKNIRLLDEPVDGHDISCKLPVFGSMYLKCSVVKKVK